MSLSASKVFYLYGAFLILGGFLAFAMAGFEARAKTAIIMGCGCGVAMTIVGFLGATRPHLIRTGRYLTGFFACLFSYRAWKIRDVPEKQYLFICFIILITGTLISLAGHFVVSRSEPFTGAGQAARRKPAKAQ